jgi:HD-GYP domain-containing protein (c-di-GMP phosphodiesterase class II)
MSTLLRDLELEGLQIQTSPYISLLRMRDREAGVHSESIRAMVREVGDRLSVPADQIIQIEAAARIHDLGTIVIPDPILKSDGVLTADERQIMQRHPQNGYEALKESEELRSVADIVLHHHERYDGAGYPHGLEGKNIPFGSRMIGVLDAFDAMINRRPYRPAMSKREACEELLIGKESQFDPEIVDALLEAVRFSVH